MSDFMNSFSLVKFMIEEGYNNPLLQGREDKVDISLFLEKYIAILRLNLDDFSNGLQSTLLDTPKERWIVIENQLKAFLPYLNGFLEWYDKTFGKDLPEGEREAKIWAVKLIASEAKTQILMNFPDIDDKSKKTAFDAMMNTTFEYDWDLFDDADERGLLAEIGVARWGEDFIGFKNEFREYLVLVGLAKVKNKGKRNEEIDVKENKVTYKIFFDFLDYRKIRNSFEQKKKDIENQFLINKVETLTMTSQQEKPLIPTSIWQRLEQSGLATKEPLKWLKSKALLAYFVEGITDKYNLKHGQKRILKPFEEMFDVKGLSGAINDYKKTGDLPIGYEIIDNVLK